MKLLPSVRARVILGSVLWTLGLLGMIHILSRVLIHHFPAMVSTRDPALVALAIVLMISGLSFLRSGLLPFRDLRRALLSVRTGDAERIGGTYPTEIQPVINDLNKLIENRERAISQALKTAGDLAHGLKTPLALLALDGEQVKVRGQSELAQDILEQIDRMRIQVDLHLSRARAVASGAVSGAHCSVGESVDGLVRTLSRLYAERGLGLEAHISPNQIVRAERQDLDEMLGNLLDNAYKWAASRITIETILVEDMLTIIVGDDGGGLDALQRAKVLLRGVRADEVTPGSGLGLAIASDLAALYGGSLTLEESHAGGLQARLTLPSI